MQKSAKNKMMNGEGKEEQSKKTKEYTYPQHNITVLATSPQEAAKKLAKLLDGEEGEE